MIRFLARLLIKNPTDYANPDVRKAYGILCGAVGIALNVILFAGKYIIGLMTKSIAITADAINNLTDAGSSVITLVGFKLAGKKQDAEHPFGHGRIEYLAGLLVSLIIMLMGVELARDAAAQILHPEEVTFSAASIAVMALSICVKLYMMFYNRGVAKKINSVAMEATASDSMSDVISTSAVLASVLVAKFTGLAIDGWTGAAVALMILWTGFKAMRDTLSPLLGSAPDPELIESIHRIVHEYPEIKGMHDLIVHDYGPGRRMISLHAEVPADGNILELHDIIDNLEVRLKDGLNCHAVIHMDPIATDDETVLAMRNAIYRALRERLHPEMTIHDLRMVEGPTHTNVVFDAVIPHNMKETDAQLQERIAAIVREIDPRYHAVVTLDRSYVG